MSIQGKVNEFNSINREIATKRRVKKKEDARLDVIGVLESKGVESPEKVYDEIMDARRGSPTEQRKLKFKKIKQKKDEH